MRGSVPTGRGGRASRRRGPLPRTRLAQGLHSCRSWSCTSDQPRFTKAPVQVSFAALRDLASGRHCPAPRWREESSPSGLSPAGTAGRRAGRRAAGGQAPPSSRPLAAPHRARPRPRPGSAPAPRHLPCVLRAGRARTDVASARLGRRGEAWMSGESPGSGTDASRLPGAAPGEVGGGAAVVEGHWDRRRPRATQVPHGARLFSPHASSSLQVARCLPTAALPDESFRSAVAEEKPSPPRLGAE